MTITKALLGMAVLIVSSIAHAAPLESDVNAELPWLSAPSNICSIAKPPAPPDATTSLLALQNQERARFGEDPLVWDEGLAKAARDWAKILATEGMFEHSPPWLRGNTGENLFMGTAGAFTPAGMVNEFLAERKDFTPGTFPNVSRTGQWHAVGHYTQIIWRGTRKVGCAITRGGGYDYLVCRYWPAGNVSGEEVY
jgi:hypothetical protein